MFTPWTCVDARCGGGAAQIELRPKAFDVLRYLAENWGRVISKNELIKAVWPDVFITDGALVQCVRDIRHALGDEGHQIVKTVPRRGYLFSLEPSDNGPSGRAPTRFEQSIQFCRTRDGVKLAMASTGRGLPLVRPPTWFNHLEYDWHVRFRSDLYRFLADRYQLIRYDGRGNGLSDRYVPEISLATFEQDLEAVVDALRLQRYALLGISQGAPIAIAHAVRHPERVSKLVINGGFALGSNKRSSAKDQETAQAHLTLMRHGWGDEHSAFLRTFSMLYFPSASAEELRASAELQRMAMSADICCRWCRPPRWSCTAGTITPFPSRRGGALPRPYPMPNSWRWNRRTTCRCQTSPRGQFSLARSRHSWGHEDQKPDVRKCPIASFRCVAAIRSESGRCDSKRLRHGRDLPCFFGPLLT